MSDLTDRLRRTADDAVRFDPRRDFNHLMARELRFAADEIDRLAGFDDLHRRCSEQVAEIGRLRATIERLNEKAREREVQIEQGRAT